MINGSQNLINSIGSSVRTVEARVGLYNGSTLVATYKPTDALKSLQIDRVGNDAKFFGYGICQKLNVKLVDKDREINITTANSFKIEFGASGEYVYPYPAFKVTEVHRDENTNELSITAYDALYAANSHTVGELSFTDGYTLQGFARACATVLGLSLKLINIPSDDISLSLNYSAGANFEGTESLRAAMDAVAEATQSIYYIDNELNLVFKRYDVNGGSVYTIDKNKYFKLDSKTSRRLSTICHATELGDNVSASLAVSGTTQYIRDNPFWELRDDIADIVDSALVAVGGLTINQFECSWHGNYLLEIGDKIELTGKDGSSVISYVLDDVITYDGSFKQDTRWSYTNDEAETAANPTSIGEALKQTYAKVDKANKEITILASETAENKSEISKLNVTTSNINATVERVENLANEKYDSISDDIDTLTQRVNATITQEEVNFTVQQELQKGVDKVVIDTTFKFDKDGLLVSKSDKDITTQITEDGMRVYKGGSNEAVLIADNWGVLAENLEATTYLVIGKNSRFEDSEDGERTCCYWIGGLTNGRQYS